MNARSEAAPAFAARLAEEAPLLLDGALGTELERHGVPCELPLWSAQALHQTPDLVLGIHQAYARAGAEVLTANTFRTQRRTLARAGLGERDDPLTTMAVALARSAARDRHAQVPEGPRVFVAGSVAPLEDCYRPDLVPSDAELEREHGRHCELLAAAAADLLLIETMNSLREATAATRAAIATGLPTLVSFVCDDRGRLLSGEPLAAAIEACARAAERAPAAFLVNCLPPSALDSAVPSLRASGFPFGFYPNLGAPIDTDEPQSPRHREALAPEAFAGWLAGVAQAEGARVLGGCCGTSPAHIAALRSSLDSKR